MFYSTINIICSGWCNSTPYCLLSAACQLLQPEPLEFTFNNYITVLLAVHGMLFNLLDLYTIKYVSDHCCCSMKISFWFHTGKLSIVILFSLVIIYITTTQASYITRSLVWNLKTVVGKICKQLFKPVRSATFHDKRLFWLYHKYSSYCTVLFHYFSTLEPLLPLRLNCFYGGTWIF